MRLATGFHKLNMQPGFAMDIGDPEMAREAIFEVIENQMRDGTPPETKETFDRLRAQGYSRLDTMKLIGCALSVEIFDMFKHKKPYNEQRYVAALKSLPELPSEDDEQG